MQRIVETKYVLLWRDMALLEMRLPVKVSASVAPLFDTLHLLWGPYVEIYALDAADMGAHATMNTRTSDTEKDTTETGERRN